MNKAFIAIAPTKDDRLLVSCLDGTPYPFKSPIAELYITDLGKALLLWRTKDNSWERKVYERQLNAEKALYARTAEYMEYFYGNDYKVVYKALDEDGKEYAF